MRENAGVWVWILRRCSDLTAFCLKQYAFFARFGLNFCLKTSIFMLNNVLMHTQGLRPGMRAPLSRCYTTGYYIIL